MIDKLVSIRPGYEVETLGETLQFVAGKDHDARYVRTNKWDAPFLVILGRLVAIGGHEAADQIASLLKVRTDFSGDPSGPKARFREALVEAVETLAYRPSSVDACATVAAVTGRWQELDGLGPEAIRAVLLHVNDERESAANVGPALAWLARTGGLSALDRVGHFGSAPEMIDARRLAMRKAVDADDDAAILNTLQSSDRYRRNEEFRDLLEMWGPRVFDKLMALWERERAAVDRYTRVSTVYFIVKHETERVGHPLITWLAALLVEDWSASRRACGEFISAYGIDEAIRILDSFTMDSGGSEIHPSHKKHRDLEAAGVLYSASSDERVLHYILSFFFTPHDITGREISTRILTSIGVPAVEPIAQKLATSPDLHLIDVAKTLGEPAFVACLVGALRSPNLAGQAKDALAAILNKVGNRVDQASLMLLIELADTQILEQIYVGYDRGMDLDMYQNVPLDIGELVNSARALLPARAIDNPESNPST